MNNSFVIVFNSIGIAEFFMQKKGYSKINIYASNYHLPL